MRLITLTILVILASTSYAKSPLSRLQDWLSSLANTEEHLLHMERIGPYTLSADGKRLLPNPYLRLDIRHNNESLPSDALVQVKSTLYQPGSNLMKNYLPIYDGRSFVIESLDFGAIESWHWDESGWLEMNIFIDGPAGQGEGNVGFEIYPPKPSTSILFKVLNISIPVVLLIVFVIIYKIRNVKLVQVNDG